MITQGPGGTRGELAARAYAVPSIVVPHGRKYEVSLVVAEGFAPTDIGPMINEARSAALASVAQQMRSSGRFVDHEVVVGLEDQARFDAVCEEIRGRLVSLMAEFVPSVVSAVGAMVDDTNSQAVFALALAQTEKEIAAEMKKYVESLYADLERMREGGSMLFTKDYLFNLIQKRLNKDRVPSVELSGDINGLGSWNEAFGPAIGDRVVAAAMRHMELGVRGHADNATEEDIRVADAFVRTNFSGDEVGGLYTGIDGRSDNALVNLSKAQGNLSRRLDMKLMVEVSPREVLAMAQRLCELEDERMNGKRQELTVLDGPIELVDVPIEVREVALPDSGLIASATHTSVVDQPILVAHQILASESESTADNGKLGDKKKIEGRKLLIQQLSRILKIESGQKVYLELDLKARYSARFLQPGISEDELADRTDLQYLELIAKGIEKSGLGSYENVKNPLVVRVNAATLAVISPSFEKDYLLCSDPNYKAIES